MKRLLDALSQTVFSDAPGKDACVVSLEATKVLALNPNESGIDGEIISRAKTLDQVAAEAGMTRSHFRRVLRVSFLAPDIVQSILRDRHPIELNAEQLSKNTVLLLSWDEQRKQLGFD